ncbi:MAG: hypothetical protein V7645_1555 [Actinomycetota bacterium]|jgi:hypothetical protein
MCRHFIVAAGTIVVVLTGTVGAVAGRSGDKASQGTQIPVLPAPGDFVKRIDNRYFPLRPGTTFIYRGTEQGKARRVSVFVTHKTKAILGIRATVVLDQVLVGGKPEEKTFDWYAQDKHGNVWYLGEESSDFVDGKWVRSDGSWEAGVNGAKAGIVMKANPRVGAAYRQEYYAGHAEDMAKVLSRNKSVTVTYGRFEHTLQTSEWTPLERGVLEYKYYVKGIGNVLTVMVKGGSEEEHLVSITR